MRLRLLRYGSVAAVLALWELSVRTGRVDPFVLPSLSGIVLRFGEEVLKERLLFHAGLTMYRALGGFVIAAAVGVLVGALMARRPLVKWFFDPLVSVGFPMPKISLMPIFVLWFGIYEMPKIIMIVVGCIFPIISATYLSTSTIDRYLIWSARNLGTSENRLLWKVVIPAALPQILSGLQIAFPTALILASVTEMLTTGGGLGNYMILAARFADSERVFVGIVTIGVMGYALIWSLARLRRWLLAWHSESIAQA
jgi:taurine transport system permease protein